MKKKGKKMLVEKLIFNILAFTLFIIIFFRMIKRNDANYVIILALSAIRNCYQFYRNSL